MARAAVLRLAFVAALVSSAAVGGSPAENPLAADRLLAATPRLRGFDVPLSADPEVFSVLRRDWHANAVRLILRPDDTDPHDPARVWQKMLDRLPGMLRAAGENHIFTVVAPFFPPLPNYAELARAGRNGAQHFLWNNPAGLEALAKQALDCVRVLQPFHNAVWLELTNEPLDWDDMPSYPRNWPAWSQQLVNRVREVSDIPLVVEVGPGGLCWGFKTFPLLKGGGVVYSVHNYQPHAYTHQGITDLAGTDLARSFGETGKPYPGVFGTGPDSYWDAAHLRRELAPAIAFAQRNHVRIYVGEFGVARWAPGGARYLQDNIELFDGLGWDWTCHAFRESPIWSPEHSPDREKVLKHP